MPFPGGSPGLHFNCAPPGAGEAPPIRAIMVVFWAAVLGDEVGVRGGFRCTPEVNLGTPGHFLVLVSRAEEDGWNGG
jgi:hypothetical protein